MSDQELLNRIVCDPNALAGKPVIRGTRLSVEYLLGLLAQGSTAEEILDEYKGLALEDIQACLQFASHSLADATFLPLASEPA
jgi:uncharacterized protein (DUF433 family)